MQHLRHSDSYGSTLIEFLSTPLGIGTCCISALILIACLSNCLRKRCKRPQADEQPLVEDSLDNNGSRSETAYSSFSLSFYDTPQIDYTDDIYDVLSDDDDLFLHN